MPIDFDAIKRENIRRYGEDIGRIGPMLLAQRYDNRSHFIFELLQNAEDALRRRTTSGLPKAVRFELSEQRLELSHFGEPFSEQDVRFICGIAESTESHALTDIGRFGIGFKSVYAFTEAPEVHSGGAHFAIDSFVWPRAIPSVQLAAGQTKFVFKFRPHDHAARGDILAGLTNLDLKTLLFLREIDEIAWSAGPDQSGTYLREAEQLTTQLRKVTLIGERKGEGTVEEQFLIADRQVFFEGRDAGRVEVAFLIRGGRIVPVENATLSVFFPTIVETHFGAVLQGPFRTTPSRDNIPRDNAWNNYLIVEMSALLRETLEVLRSQGLLTASALSALPIHKERFPTGSLFHPLFAACKDALLKAPLVPCLGECHQPASSTRLGRTKEIRELFSPSQLGHLLGHETELHWVTEEITRDRMPELRQYLLTELQIPEVDPDMVARQLTAEFLSAQDIAWMIRFYEFLGKQEGVWKSTGLREKPIIRTAKGTQVVPFEGKHPCVFLPSETDTEFPTVHPDICRSDAALEFLQKLGLTTPDPVDDVIEHLLPKYVKADFAPTDEEYSSDLVRIHAALQTENKKQEVRLLDKLKATPIFYAQDLAGGPCRRTVAKTTYLPTERLRQLFEGVPGILLIDLVRGGQKYEDQRRLARLCGASEYLAPVECQSNFSREELREMRRRAGCPDSTREDVVADYDLHGLSEILAFLNKTAPNADVARACILWEALCDLEEQRGSASFSGKYTWFYYNQRSCTFDAAWLRLLNQSRWIPKPDGGLGLPSEVVFEEISPAWRSNPFLESKIQFKPRAVVQLAHHIGLEPELLDLLREKGITSASQARKLLGIAEPHLPEPTSTEPATGNVNDAIAGLLGDSPEPTGAVGYESDEYAPGSPEGKSSGSRPQGGGVAGAHNPGASVSSPTREGASHARSSGSTTPNTRPEFHTYVKIDAGDEPDAPEGLSENERLAVEEAAIQFILQEEPSLKPTPPNNPGFDLYEGESQETATRIVEVKSRKGAWSGPVALSSTQFTKAQEAGAHFWLYVVENIGNPTATRIIRIQDPAGRARHFCYDPGWRALAESI